MGTIAASTRLAGSGPSAESATRRLLDLGFERFVLHPNLRRPAWEALKAFLPKEAVAASCLFAPLPPPTSLGLLPPPRIGSLDPDERREVQKRCRESVEFAARHGIPTVILPPVLLEEPDLDEVRKAVEKAHSPTLEKEAWERLQQKRSVSAMVSRQLDSLLGTLSRLLDVADRHGIRVAMVPGGFPCEQPDLVELERCFEEFSGAPLSAFGDTMRLERYLRSGGPGAADFLATLQRRLSGVLAHDGESLREREHLPLGAGEVNLQRWEGLEERLDPERLWVLDLQRNTAEEDLLESRSRLESLFARRESGNKEKGFKAPTASLDFS